MDFSWMDNDKILNTAFSPKEVSHMDMTDKVEFIRELAIRLQRAINEVMVLKR